MFLSSISTEAAKSSANPFPVYKAIETEVLYAFRDGYLVFATLFPSFATKLKEKRKNEIANG